VKSIKINKTLTVIMAFILLILIFTGCINNSSDKSNNNQILYTEDFEFKLLNGTKKNTSDYRNKNVLIDFFGVYCQPCRKQMLVLTQIFEKYKNSDLELLSIDAWIASGETANLVEQFISSYGEQGVYLNWTFGVDDRQGTLVNKYASKGVPTLYLLDKNGNIYYSKVGYTEYSILDEKIIELISMGG
jgi:thiol-disulfide isomerase/thioredoxin